MQAPFLCHRPEKRDKALSLRCPNNNNSSLCTLQLSQAKALAPAGDHGGPHSVHLQGRGAVQEGRAGLFRGPLLRRPVVLADDVILLPSPRGFRQAPAVLADVVDRLRRGRSVAAVAGASPAPPGAWIDRDELMMGSAEGQEKEAKANEDLLGVRRRRSVLADAEQLQINVGLADISRKLAVYACMCVLSIFLSACNDPWCQL